MASPRLRLTLVLLVLVAAALVSHRFVSAPSANRGVARATTAGSAGATATSATTTDPAVCGPVFPAAPAGDAKFADAVAVRAQRDEALAKTAAFTDWLTTWRRSDSAAQPALAAAGRELAVARRAALKHLIQTDPQRALALAIPPGLRSELPAGVQELLENRIDARGEFEVAITHVGASARYDRAVIVDGTRYDAFVFGRREQEATKIGLPLHGIAVDGVLALDATPYRLLDDTEKAARGIASDQIAAAIGRDVKTFASTAEFEAYAQRLIDAESVPGPHVVEKMSGGPDPTVSTPPTAAVTSPSSWINGAKRVLWVQVDFADDPGAVATVADIGVTNTAVSDFYAANSQGKTTLAFTVLPAVLRLPKDKAYYNLSGSTVSELQDAASVLAKQYDAANGNAGTYDPDRYDRWIVLFKRVPAYTFGGQAILGGARVRLNANILSGTTGHELGHTQSLDHSHYWLPSGTSAVGPGTHVEYGDVFDIMGSSGSSPNNHFNVAQKAKLGYLDATSITTVTQAGTYRINRHDHRDASGFRALKIAPAGLNYEYWVEHRQFGPTTFNAAQLDRLRNGVLLHWGPGKAPPFTSGPGSYLVDATPGSAGGANDAALRIGEAFTDPDAGVTIKPLAVGGNTPNEYIDVQVAFGAIDGNHNPTLQADLPAGPLLARSNIVFTANATDPDGDPVYYHWDFGDASLQPILNNITRRFTKGGSYSLRVSAHDGKGGIAAKTLAFNVVDPLITWTQRRVGAASESFMDIGFAGGQFVAVGLNATIVTSPDGTNWTRRDFPGGNSLTGVASSGTRYVLSGYRFSNPTQKGLSAYSDDGVTWTPITLDTGLAQFWGIAYGAGRFVMVGDAGSIYSSVDGVAWTASPTGISTSFRAVAYAAGLFVATGDSGRVFTSVDGVTWANRSVATGNTLASVTRHNGAWFTSSATVECFTSVDGNTWTRISTAGRSNSTQHLISAAGVLLGTTGNGSIAFTEDPASWSSYQIDSTPSTTFTGATIANGELFVVGSRGLIYATTLPPPTAPPIAAPVLRNPADSLKVSVGRKNVLAAGGTGFVKLELYANGTKVSEISASAGALTWTPTAIGSYSLVVRGVTATGESVVSAAVPAQAGLADWDWRNPVPVGTDLSAAVRVGDTWWIIGGTGTLLSIDAAGVVTPVAFPTTQRLTGIAYGNGRFIVSGPYVDGGSREDIGSLWTSTDGYTWTPLLTEIVNNYNLTFVTFASGRWLAGGTGGILLTSPDGLVWSRQVSALSVTIRNATFANGLWVAVGAAGKITTSPDTVRWTERASGVISDLWGVASNNGVFVAAGLSGTLVRSTDGITWTRVSAATSSNLFWVTAWAGSFLAVGNTGTVLVSTDGTTWTQASLDGNFSDIFCAVGSGSDGLLVGRAGEIYTGNSPSAWHRITQGTAETRNSVIYAGGRFVAVGLTTDPISRNLAMPVQFSTDGMTWTRAAGNASFTQNNVGLNAIAYGQQTYVTASGGARIFTSTDADTWIARNSGVTAALQAAAAGPASFVVAGAIGTIISSPDGATWTTRTSGTTQSLRAAAYGNGRFVVVGDAGTVLQSTDGATWTAATSGVTASLLTLGWWQNFGFIAAGNSGTMISSLDGLTWRQIETGVADSITAITQTPIGLVAAAGASGTLLVSLDGENWSIATLPADRTVRGLAASAGAIVAVGDSGTTVTFELVDTTPAPVIAMQPGSIAAVAGVSATFRVDARNAMGAVYQWMKDGVPVAGANSPVYSVPVVTTASAGTYVVSITSPTGTVVSAPAALTLASATDPGRLVNLSILTALSSATDSFTFGVVVGGTGTVGDKRLLVRAAGPSLVPLGVTGVLADPKLEFFTGTVKVGENDNWGGGADLAAVMAQVGAFPYASTTSLDAAIFLPNLASGNNSARITGTGAGAVIAELYDATPSAQFTATTPRLINVSVLKNIGPGVTAGFVIGGSSARTVLVRAIGPTLGAAPFNVPGVVADPQLKLFDNTATKIAENDNWGGTPELSTAFAKVGAFVLPGDSRDAALLITLQPGNYTVQVAGVGGTGVALVEVYEVP